MIGLLVMLCCMYRFIFSEWELTQQQGAMLVLAVLIEFGIEWLIGHGILKMIKETKP